MKFLYLGRKPYAEVLSLQTKLFTRKVEHKKSLRLGAPQPASLVSTTGKSPLKEDDDIVLLVEHSEPVYTMGRRDTSDGLPSSSSQTDGVVPQNLHLPCFRLKRGGGLTWHGPGQLTMYPIIDVMRLYSQCRLPATAPEVADGATTMVGASRIKGKSPLLWYTHVLEQAMVAVAGDYGLKAAPGKVGVWVAPMTKSSGASEGLLQPLPPTGCPCLDSGEFSRSRKIGSIGLQVSNWISMHGIGFNVENDLSHFEKIVMCELPGRKATSISEELRARGEGAGSAVHSHPLVSVPIVGGLLAKHFLNALEQKESIALEWIQPYEESSLWNSLGSS
jgi:lipoyl(octanoyl) transferase